MARKVRTLKLSSSTKITQGGDGARFAGNQRREQAVRRVPHLQIEAHPFRLRHPPIALQNGVVELQNQIIVGTARSYC